MAVDILHGAINPWEVGDSKLVLHAMCRSPEFHNLVFEMRILVTCSVVPGSEGTDEAGEL